MNPTLFRPGSATTKPVPRDANWVNRHDGFVALAKKGDIDVLILGDSITDGWRNGGKEVWTKDFEPLRAANFGIGGDRTEHALWRLHNGELEGLHPKVVVLMIGANNIGNKPDDIADGIKAIVAEVRKKVPAESKTLLLGVFPRGAKATDPAREKIKEVNETISPLDDRGQHVRYLDIGETFLDKDGNIPHDIMHDYLHPTALGYQVWAEATGPTLNELLK